MDVGLDPVFDPLRVKDTPTESTYQAYEEAGTDLAQLLTAKVRAAPPWGGVERQGVCPQAPPWEVWRGRVSVPRRRLGRCGKAGCLSPGAALGGVERQDLIEDDILKKRCMASTFFHKLGDFSLTRTFRGNIKSDKKIRNVPRRQGPYPG